MEYREGIFQSTPDGRYIAANPALAEMYGFESPEELIRSCDDISRKIYVDPSRREDFKRLMHEDGMVRGFELQVFHKDGTKFWISVNARTVRDEQGTTLYYEGTSQDVTERKRAEERSTAFANLARKLSDARTHVDAAGIIVQTAQDLFGWDACNLDLYSAKRDLVFPLLNIDTIDGKQTDVTSLITDGQPTTRGRRVIERGPELILRNEPISFDCDSIPFGDKQRPSASLMSAPIQHGSEVVGLLSIQSYTPRAYDHAALKGFASLAEHCGEAINRIRAEKSLRESEERDRDLVENSHELICTHALDGTILSANRAAFEVLGYPETELTRRLNIRDILAPEVRDQFPQYMNRILNQGATSGLMLVQTRSGERRVFEYYNSLRTEGVAAPIVRGIARDITDCRQAEKALRESEERYRELFENAKDATYVHNMSGCYLAVNRAAETLSGYTRDEIIGRPFWNFVAPEYVKQAREYLCKKLEEVGETTYEIEIITKSGKRVPVEVSSRFIYEDGVPIGVQGTARDMTERKRAQLTLQKYSRRLIEAQEAERERIARELHDEIGQVLTAVKINLHSVQRSCRTPECLPHINESIDVVDEALSRVQELSLSLRPALLDDLGLAAALRWYVDRFAERTGIQTDFLSQVDGGRLSGEVETACFRIAQEALTNVARHAQATRALVRIERSREALRLTVTDEGIGFDVKSFDRQSSALGLRGMTERALAVNGAVTIDSNAGKGTKVLASFRLEDS